MSSMMHNREFFFRALVGSAIDTYHHNLVSSFFLLSWVKAHDPIYRALELKESKKRCGGGCFSTCIPS